MAHQEGQDHEVVWKFGLAFRIINHDSTATAFVFESVKFVLMASKRTRWLMIFGELVEEHGLCLERVFLVLAEWGSCLFCAQRLGVEGLWINRY